MYLTEKEIFSTGEALEKSIVQTLSQRMEIEGFFAANPQRRFVFLGCGSSYMLAKSCARMFAVRKGTSAVAIAGGDYLVDPGYYADAVSGSIVVTLSRSGMTSEILRSVQHIKNHSDAKFLSITMKEENDLDKLSDLSIKLPWAYDDSVCQTRTVTNLYVVSLLVNAVCYGDEEQIQAVTTAGQNNRAFMAEHRTALESIGKRTFRNVIVLADGPLCGPAEEGSLAFTEIALVPGHSFNLLDYRHGPIVINNKDTLTIVALRPGTDPYQPQMITDLKTHGGTVVTMGERFENDYQTDLHIGVGPIGDFAVMGIYFIYLCQIIALSKALADGVNPDEPTGLDAFITLK